MYSLDINFLNDRPEYRPDTVDRRRRPASTGSKQPLYLGAAAAIALLALSGGGWLFLQTQNTQLSDRKVQLETELGALKVEQAKLTSINAEVKQIQDETTALASVFNAIKPWSSTFNDVSSRTPPRVRILKIEELPPPATTAQASPSPGAAVPLPVRTVAISGAASNFDDINDFLLVLQNSKFLKEEGTKIVSAEMGQPRVITPLRLGDSQGGENARLELPAEALFRIETQLTDVPTSDLLRELETKGATGLVTRIETLQQKGVGK